MEKQNLQIGVPTGKLSAKKVEQVDPTTQQLIQDLKRHFNGIISAITRWSLAIQKKK